MKKPDYIMGTDIVNGAHGTSITCVVKRMHDEQFIATYRVDVVHGTDNAATLIDHIASFYDNAWIVKDDQKRPIKPISMEPTASMKNIMENRRLIAEDYAKQYVEELKKYFDK